MYSANSVLLLTGSVTGTVAVLLSGKSRRRIEYLFIALVLSGLNTVFSVVFALASPNGSGFSEILKIALYSLSSGFVSIFIFLGLLPFFENAFNIITNFRLGELTDHDRPLLQRLREQAPGTFNHSLVLGNIAEACALAIGENTYLARAAAYYHDIGKLKNPQYFIENQRFDSNPHDELSPEMSVSLIKKHMQNGVAMAREYRLPPEIISAIREHHGTLLIKYFYYKARKYTDGELDEFDFCYDGPRPRSKISAIIMIADGAEAAIRSVKDAPDEVKEKIINEIIKERMDRGQFSECDITMKDIEKIKETILTTFAGVFHERIAYPNVTVATEE
jgi:putative nucleotidyltransferase with HDIG domain